MELIETEFKLGENHKILDFRMIVRMVDL